MTEVARPARPLSMRLLDVLLAPAHWLERARGLKRLGLIAVYLAIALPLGVLAWREVRLVGLPDVGDPFDMEAFADRRVADDRNAFVLYRQADAKLKPLVMPVPPLGSPPGRASAPTYDWGTAQPEVKQWLADNQEALELWRQGTERPEALDVPPRELSIDTLMPTLQELRQFAQLAKLEGTRRAASGDMAGAYEMYRGIMRSGHHAVGNGTLIGRLVGVALHGMAATNLELWAADARTDSAALRRALADARAFEAARFPNSFSFQHEYYWAMRTFKDPKELAKLDQANDNDMGGTIFAFNAAFPRHHRWLYHEPERSLRVYRLVMTNLLAHCDQPRDQRPRTTGKHALMFDPVPGDPPAAHALSADQFDAWFESAPLARLILPAMNNILNAMDRQQSRHDMLILTLAEELYKREHGGALPRTLADLVPDYIDALPDGFTAMDPPMSVITAPTPLP